MAEPKNMYHFEETDLLSPNDEIPESGPLFVINSSRSNKKLELNDEKTTLTAPGTRGSIQPISRDMLRSPGVLAMWTTGDIQISTSVKAQRAAVSEIVLKDQERKAHQRRIQSIAQESPSVNQATDDSKVTDVSYRFHRYISDSDRGHVISDGSDTNTDLI